MNQISIDVTKLANWDKVSSDGAVTQDEMLDLMNQWADDTDGEGGVTTYAGYMGSHEDENSVTLDFSASKVNLHMSMGDNDVQLDLDGTAAGTAIASAYIIPDFYSSYDAFQKAKSSGNIGDMTMARTYFEISDERLHENNPNFATEFFVEC
ncbi:MAG: hypothetical protein AABZ14_03230 [Candidatus Margulisiibacteriota bacterium]